MTNKGPRDIIKNQKDVVPDWLLSSKKRVSFCWVPSSGLQAADFWLYPHVAEWGLESRWRLFDKGTKPIHEGSSSRHNNHHRKTLPPITLGLGFWHMDFGGHKRLVYCTGFDLPFPALAPTYPVSLVLQPSHHFCGLTHILLARLDFYCSQPANLLAQHLINERHLQNETKNKNKQLFDCYLKNLK